LVPEDADAALNAWRTLLFEEKIHDGQHCVFDSAQMIPQHEHQYKHPNPSLTFHSQFESGNLEKVWRVPPEAVVDPDSCPSLHNQYIMAMHFDNNTTNHSQWFYFGVKGMQPGKTYQFFIVNCIKGRKSMFTEGMKVCAYSELENQQSPSQEHRNLLDSSAGSASVGWRRVGHDIQYFQNNYLRPESMTKRFWTLQFCYTPDTVSDTIYFTQGVPYTYSYLQRFVGHLQKKLADRSDVLFTRELLCHTVGGNRCDVLMITSSGNGGDLGAENVLCENGLSTDDHAAAHDDEDQGAAALDLPATKASQRRHKEFVVFSARVHPGETQASHMMHGTLRFLTSDDKQAVELREKYVFVIVPMLNPDGCQAGNYRTNLYGFDLNRTWKDPDRDMHPTIYHTKRLIGRLNSVQPVLLYVDFHGHARKKNIFIYGCNSKLRDRMLNMRVYPHIVARRTQLSFPDCKFNLFKSKMGAARCAVFKAFDIDNSYTIEASLCGPLHRRVHYGSEDYGSMGAGLARSLLTYEDPEERAKSYRQLENMFPEKKKTPPKRRAKSRLEQRFGRADTSFFDNRPQGVEIRVKSKTLASKKSSGTLFGSNHAIEHDGMTSGKINKTTRKQLGGSLRKSVIDHKSTTVQSKIKRSKQQADDQPDTTSASTTKGQHAKPALITLKSLLVSSALLLILRYLWKIIFGF